jgi:hypothetical protein
MYRDFELAFVDTIDRLISLALRLQPRADQLRCRFYGGWADEIKKTSHYDLLRLAVAKNSQGRSGITVKVDFATSLMILPAEHLVSTSRLSAGLPTFETLTVQRDCPLPTIDCSLSAMRRWQRGRCPDRRCPVIERNAFCTRHQKTVDTALCCDAIYLAQNEPDDWLIVASDDDDLVPALVSAAKLRPRVAQLRPPRLYPHYYDSLLTDLGVTLVAW